MQPDATNGGPRDGKGQLLRDLAEKLESRGLSSRVVTYSGDKPDDELIEELHVTNPAASERGTVRIGDDGAITWEFFADLSDASAGRILDEVTNMLRATGMRLQRERRHGTELTGTAEQQLVYLNTHWGRSYSFAAPGAPDGTWKAKARFGEQDEVDDSSSAGLLEKVKEHHQTHRREEL